MKPIKAIIVDDSRSFLLVFDAFIKQFPEINLLQRFTNATKAMRYVKEHKPDLVFLDIELGNYNGISLAKELRNIRIPYAFISGYEKYAVQAANLNPLGYVSKPVHPDQLKEVIHNWNLLYGNEIVKNKKLNSGSVDTTGVQTNQSKSVQYPKRILLPMVGNMLIIKLEDLVLIEAKSNYSIFTMNDGSIYTSSRSLKVYADTIQSHPDFLRIHRSHIVNKNYIVSIIRNKQNKSFVVMHNKRELEIVSQKKENIIRNLVV